MKARYTDITASGYNVTLENGRKVLFTHPYFEEGRRESNGDFTRFTQAQRLAFLDVEGHLRKLRPDDFEPVYLDIPEEFLK